MHSKKIRIKSLKQEFIILLKINVVVLFEKYEVALKALTKLIFQNSLLYQLIIHTYNTKLRARKILNINKNFYLFIKETFAINIFKQFDKHNNFKLIAILLFLAYYNIIVTRICLLKLSITRALFSAFIKSILFIKITNNLVSIFERTYNLAIAIFDIFLSFCYICITLLKFNLIFLDFNFEDFDRENLVNFDLAILNMLVDNKSRSFFYNASILIKLNFNNFFIKYSSKSCAILFDQQFYKIYNVKAATRKLY